MWKRQAGGRTLTFRLAGINNQNFLMRDEETGSYWQQISGKCISGRLAGQQLELVHSDELSFALWKQENASGTVLAPVAQFAKEYERKDWDKTMQRVRTVVDTSKTGIKPRELMFGVEINGAAKAFPVPRILDQKLIQDRVGSEPVIVVVGTDNQSIRVFSARLPGQAESSDFYRRTDASAQSALLMDAATGSNWIFEGCAVAGKLNGQCLKPVAALKDYWFDWKQYHPDTAVYKQ